MGEVFVIEEVLGVAFEVIALRLNFDWGWFGVYIIGLSHLAIIIIPRDVD
jgi:hypothetical protein